MKCKNCGAELEDGDMFCGNCGAKVEIPEPEADLKYGLVNLSLTELMSREAQDPSPEVEFALFYKYKKFVSDDKKLYLYANKCAEQNYPDGIAALGYCYLYGNGECKKNPQKTHELMEKAMSMGSAFAAYMAGFCSIAGDAGFQKDADRQFEYMLKAAELGYPEALEAVAKLYAKKDDEQNAAVWFKKAAQYNMPYSMVQLGSYYFMGDTLEEDYDKAFELFSKAFELNRNVDDIHYWLGVSYRFGKGVEKDSAKAIEHFTLCYRDPYAHKCLGEMYYYGEGVKKDLKMAEKYLTKAVDGGLDSAKELLDALPSAKPQPAAVDPDLGEALSNRIALAACYQKGSMKVVITSIDASKKVKLIQYVKNMLTVPMIEAKNMIENCPLVLKEKIDPGTAETICSELTQDYNCVCEAVDVTKGLNKEEKIAFWRAILD